ncbi:hypothetical protein ABMA27_007748 [Loxostege sticticalis]|uniref:RNase H type-1 domain-containing protein n=1 Tax=Loxostege sticticalis TaxID=481309 RepID=A0ABR3HD91_LOXSC
MKGINILRSLAGISWGSDPRILNMLYKSLVRSHFDYSCLAYINANHSVLRKLDVIQNMALRIISGAMRTTPINSMEVETCIEPLSLRRLQLAEKFCSKILARKDPVVLQKFNLPPYLQRSLQNSSYMTANDILNGNSPSMLKIISHVNDISKNMYRCNLWPIFTCKYDSLLNKLRVDVSSVNSKEEFFEFIGQKNHSYKLYTDGSKSSNEVRSAIYDPQSNYCKCLKIGSDCSIFTAEAYAIFQALMYIKSVYIDNSFRDILILSDSKSVLMCIENNNVHFKTNYIIYKIRDIIREIGQPIFFKWIPSHRGIPGNEIVDEVANSEPHEDHTTICEVPFTDLYTQMKENCRSLWKNYWMISAQNKGRWYAGIQKELPVKPWYYKEFYISRRYITTINRLRFGHCRTPSHLHRMKIISSSACEYCHEENADLNHLIMACPEFGIQRLVLAAELSQIEKEESERNCISRHIHDLLCNPKMYGPIFKYVLDSIGHI